jgi:dTDP-4-dehydrorhamnose 3,5-epimerase
MEISKLSIPEVLLIKPVLYKDNRGYFMELFHGKKLLEHGGPGAFVQDNLSHSNHGVLRGLHYQLCQPQGKLVQAVRGEIFDVAVDVRKGSPWFGQWVGAILSEGNRHQLYIPPGFAHGFCVLSKKADVLYKCTAYYTPGDEQGILWDDPDVAIEWPNGEFVLSEKDKKNKKLQDMESVLPMYGSCA